MLSPVFSYVQPEDQAQLATLYQGLHAMGMRPTRELFKRRFGLQEDEFTLETPPAPGANLRGTGPQFAETPRFTPDQQQLETLVEATLPAFQEGVDDLVRRVVAVALRVETPEEIPLLAFEEFAGDGLENLAAIQTTALAAANLAGRFTAKADAKPATHTK